MKFYEIFGIGGNALGISGNGSNTFETVYPAGTGDGVTDSTTAVQTAINNANSAGGGIVQLPVGTVLVSQVQMKANVWLRGSGRTLTTLKLKDSSNQSLVILATAATDGTNLSDMTLEGNRSNQTAGNWHGVFYDNTGEIVLRRNTVKNVLATHFRGDAFHFEAGASGEGEQSDLIAYFNDRYGVYVGIPDLFFTNVDVGQSGKQGIYIATSNTHFANSKAWFSGRLDSANGDGFYITTVGRVMLTGCEAQDNKTNGFYVLNSNDVTMLVNADSNGTGTTAAGIKLDGASYCNIVGSTFDRNGSPVQAYGIQFANSNTHNIISLTSKTNLTSDTNGTIASTNFVTINENVVAGSSITVGNNPASAGVIAIPNNSAITGRNNANSGDVSMLSVRTDDGVALGASRLIAYSSAIDPGGDKTFALGATNLRWNNFFTTNTTNQTDNGGQWIQSSISELLTLSTGGTTTDTAANLLPANSIIEAVVARVTTTITTATSWQLGDATIAGRFSAANATMTAGTTQVGTVQADQTGTSGPRQVAAAKVRVTTVGTPGAGAIRITVFYRQFVPQTS
jgi:hypothetical protein